MTRACSQKSKSIAQAKRDEWRRQVEATKRSLLALIDRMVETKSPTVIKAIGSEFEKLERKKFAIAEKADQPLPNAGNFENCIELSRRLTSWP